METISSWEGRGISGAEESGPASWQRWGPSQLDKCWNGAPQRKGEHPGKGCEEKGHRDEVGVGVAQAADPQRRRLSPQSREELSSCSGC